MTPKEKSLTIAARKPSLTKRKTTLEEFLTVKNRSYASNDSPDRSETRLMIRDSNQSKLPAIKTRKTDETLQQIELFS